MACGHLLTTHSNPRVATHLKKVTVSQLKQPGVAEWDDGHTENLRCKKNIP